MSSVSLTTTPFVLKVPSSVSHSFRQVVWSGKKPLWLEVKGATWILEKETEQFKILRVPSNDVGEQAEEIYFVSLKEVAQKKYFEWQGVRIAVEGGQPKAAAFEIDAGLNRSKSRFTLFRCYEHHILETVSLSKPFACDAFELKVISEDKIVLRKKTAGWIDFAPAGKGFEPRTDTLELTIEELSKLDSFIHSDIPGVTWRIGASEAVEASWANLPKQKFGSSPESRTFFQTVGVAFAVFMLFMIGVKFFTNPESQSAGDQLQAEIPKKYEKLIMTQVVKGGGQKSMAGRSKDEKEKVFRQQVQTNVKKMMSGGLRKYLNSPRALALLQNQKFGERSLASVQAVSPSNVLAAAGGQGAAGDGNINVGSLGQGVSGGMQAGYGTGGKGTALTGQGKGFIAMDLSRLSVDEGLSRDEVGKVIHAHLDEIRYCYESAMLVSDELEGRLMVDFSIGGAGIVTKAKANENTSNDQRLEDCVVKRLSRWQFPKPKGGVTVAVSYPFLFKVLKK